MADTDTSPTPNHRDRHRAGRRHRCRAGRADRRLRAREARAVAHGPRGRRGGRRHQPHGRARRLALRHRRPPLLHQGAARSRQLLARDPPRRGLPAAAPDEPHLLRRASSSTTRSRPCNALATSASCEAVRCVLSYVVGRASGRRRTRRHFEGWVAARFGWRLYRIFFKTYTEKVWGVPADRAAGRLGRAAHQEPVAVQGDRSNAVLPKRNQKDITSLIEEFQYPKYGPGMMWEACRDKVEAAGSKVLHGDRGRRRSATSDGRAVAVSPRRPTGADDLPVRPT